MSPINKIVARNDSWVPIVPSFVGNFCGVRLYLQNFEQYSTILLLHVIENSEFRNHVNGLYIY